jgi:tetratricopeptide (TPR) repeat protein
MSLRMKESHGRAYRREPRMFRQALVLISIFGLSIPAAAQVKDTMLPRNTIDCRQFKKSGANEWTEVGTAVFNLGDVDDINLTDQPVTPGYFKFGGIELYAVLEGKCGLAGYLNRSRKDQAKGDNDSAIANSNQALAIDPKSAEAFGIRGSAYEGKGDFARAIADYDQALKLDPKLESASSRKTALHMKLAKDSVLSAPAESQMPLERVGAVLKEGLETNRDASKAPEVSASEAPASAEASEPRSQERAIPSPDAKNASLQLPMESGSCRAKKLVYAANGGGAGAPIVEIVFEGKRGGEATETVNSEFSVREQKNSQVAWSYQGKYVQKDNSARFEFVAGESKRRKLAVLEPHYIKPNRNGTGEAILYLGGLTEVFASKENARALKFEGGRPAGALPEVFYFDRCE